MNLLWIPLINLNVAGRSNVTPIDLILVISWVVAGVNLLVSHESMSDEEKVAWKIVVWANLPLVLSPVASYFVADSNYLLGGILVHLKRIGLASILVPLSVQSNICRVRRIFVLSVWLSAILLYFGPPGWLQVGYNSLLGTVYTRNSSLVFNPNTLAFVTSINALILLTFTEKENKLFIKALLLLAFVLSLVTFASSGSRGGTMGLISGLLFYTISRRSPFLVILLWLGFFAGLWVSRTPEFLTSELRSRWLLVLDRGLEEENLSARLQYQAETLVSSPEYPIGVGINSNLMRQTDSIYFDYLAAMGLFGFVSVLILIGIIWRSQKAGLLENIMARSVLICAIVFSATGLGLASPFVSSIFFLVIGYGLSAAKLPFVDKVD